MESDARSRRSLGPTPTLHFFRVSRAKMCFYFFVAGGTTILRVSTCGWGRGVLDDITRSRPGGDAGNRPPLPAIEVISTSMAVLCSSTASLHPRARKAQAPSTPLEQPVLKSEALFSPHLFTCSRSPPLGSLAQFLFSRQLDKTDLKQGCVKPNSRHDGRRRARSGTSWVTRGT